jgi:hypothetical protein
VQAACAAVESELGLDNRDLLTIVNAERKKGFRRPDGAQDKRDSSTPPPKEPAGTDLQLEADFLALLTEEKGEFIPWAVNELSPEVFHHGDFRRLFEALSSGEMKAEELNGVAELSPSFLRIEDRTEKKHREAMLIDLASALRKRHLKRQLAQLKDRQTEAEKAGETEKALQLAQQMVLLKRQYSQGVEAK